MYPPWIRELLSLARRAAEPKLEPGYAAGSLSAEQLDTLFSALQLLADDPGTPRAEFEAHVRARAAAEAAWVSEYRAAAELLDASARRRLGRAFCELSRAQRETVLRALLPSYPHPLAQASWVRRLRLTRHNTALFLASRPSRRFRRLVVADLLAYYYNSGRGWATVGYSHFPGRARGEAETCEVKGITREGTAIVLELTDATVERLRPETLRIEPGGAFSCRTKGGRQVCRFSRSAHNAIAQYIDATPDGFALRVGGSEQPICNADASR